MAESLSPSSDPREQMNILEVYQQLHSQPVVSEHQYRVPKEKFSILEATAYSLYNQLQKSNNTHSIEGPGKTEVSSEIELQGPMKEIEELKVKLKQLRENFPEIQNKITQLKDMTIGCKKELTRIEPPPEKEEGSCFTMNTTDEGNWTISYDAEFSDADLSLNTQVCLSAVSQANSTVEVT
ncbi:putative neuroblastoma breakpoint family member 5, partial [Tupaia chinensis]|uniref:putative neuroblastoma breakpoint family member 5 n=1 Tax=Tupaia chinensis TaxID=246437 RepID=UPI000FFB5485